MWGHVLKLANTTVVFAIQHAITTVVFVKINGSAKLTFRAFFYLILIA